MPVRVCYEASFCLSADVTAAYDPNFSDVYEKRNAAWLNHGIGLCKYTGARGKSGASDADAETVAYARRIFDGARRDLADRGAGQGGCRRRRHRGHVYGQPEHHDAGLPAYRCWPCTPPFETVAKLDCYETYKGMKAVFQAENWI